MTTKKNDASESAFVGGDLEFVRSATYDIKFPQLKGREFCPVDGSVDNGAEVVIYKQYDAVGQARLIASYADDFPRADVLAREFSSPVKGLGSSYGYSIQEMRAAARAGVPLEQRKANAARRAMEEKLDRICQLGDTAVGLYGLLNQPNALTYTVPADGTGGSDDWATKTPDQILRDLHGCVNYIVTQTKESESPDTLLLPLTAFQTVSTTRMGDGSDVTILSMFLATTPYIRSVSPWAALETAGAGPTRRMVAYRKDSDALVLVMPQEFEQFPTEIRGAEAVVLCHMRTGGVVMFYPHSMCYADGF